MSSITLALENGKFLLCQEGKNRNIYKVVGRTTPDTFTNKDLSDPSNNLGIQYYNYTVSNNPKTRSQYSTIQAAINAAAPLATPENQQNIYILEGRYTENVVMAANVNLVGVSSDYTTKNGTIVIGIISSSVNDSEMTINNLIVDSPTEPMNITGNATIIINNCNINGATEIIVNNGGASLIFLESTIKNDTNIITSASNLLAFVRCYIGGLFTEDWDKMVTVTSGTLKMFYSTVRARIATPMFADIRYCMLSGGVFYRINMTNTTLTSMYNIFESPAGDNPCITGSGTYIDSYNSYIGTSGISPGITLLFQDIYNPFISGVYTPTMTSDIVGQSANGSAMYSRSGRVITVSLQALLSIGSSGPEVSIFVQLPLKQSNFNNEIDALGTVRIIQPSPAGEFNCSVYAVPGSTLVKFTGTAAAASNFMCSVIGQFSFLYV